MKVLRLKIYQPHAHYRIPFTFVRRHTYPIPPYSTVIGLICNVLGIRNQENEKFKALKEGLSLAIYGKFQTMTREYVWFRNFEVNAHNARFSSPENRSINQVPEHPGGQIPIRIDVLENVNLIIYIHHPDEIFLLELANAFVNSKNRIYPLHLGRAEDWILFEEKLEDSIKIIDIDKSTKRPIYGKFDYYTWIPDPERDNKYLDHSIYDKSFKIFFRKVKGSSHFITSFYIIKNGIRNFKHILVKLFEQGDFPFHFGKPFEFLYDKFTDNKTNKKIYIPLFFCKMLYPGGSIE